MPASMHAAVLAELHSSHPGIVRMKGVARAQVWWPCLNAAIPPWASPVSVSGELSTPPPTLCRRLFWCQRVAQ